MELVSSILNEPIIKYKLTEDEFNVLINIQPYIIESPDKDKKDLANIVGKMGDKIMAGAYIFTNKKN